MIYLDHNATTPVLPEAMMPYFTAHPARSGRHLRVIRLGLLGRFG
jgi:cysteine sulfinate desulfinase/cysteine desulfurase-like protein